MNPATSLIVNLAITFLGGGFAAVQGMSAGGSAVETYAGAGVAAIGILNTILHGLSTPQAGPLVKKD